MVLAMSMNAYAEIVSFDKEKPGTLPADWISGVTGQGQSIWTIAQDKTSSNKSNVLRQSGMGTFPWCVKKGVSIVDGFVEVKFKPISGKEDQAGGVVWRFKDANNYYVARANALENNVSLYYTENGKRITLEYVDAPVARNEWHRLRVEYRTNQIKVFLDGKAYIEKEDKHITGAGSVGVWTKADSVTDFDDFLYGNTKLK